MRAARLDKMRREMQNLQKRFEKKITWLEKQLEERPSSIEVAIALSLYGYNVSPLKRAQDLLAVRDPHAVPSYIAEIAEKMVKAGFVPTELGFNWATTYVDQALERYGQEAVKRVACEKRFAG